MRCARSFRQEGEGRGKREGRAEQRRRHMGRAQHMWPGCLRCILILLQLRPCSAFACGRKGRRGRGRREEAEEGGEGKRQEAKVRGRGRQWEEPGRKWERQECKKGSERQIHLSSLYIPTIIPLFWCLYWI